MKLDRFVKHTLTLAAAASLAGVTACSSSDDPHVAPESTTGNAIRFAAYTDLASRAGDITTNNLTSFNVYAYTGTATSPSLFMDNVTVSKTGTNTWTYSPVKYWPANESVDFYAFAPASWVGTSGPLKPVNYTVDTYADQDLVYAVAPNLSGNIQSPSAQVVFNFRHALSKVTIKMSSSSSDLKVVVSNVVLANIKSTGNFNFPVESTSGTAASGNTGAWTDQNTPTTYLLHITGTPTDTFTLTTTPTDMSASGLGGGKYLLPQNLAYTTGGSSTTDNYLAVMCSVYDSTTGDKLWPNANTPAENLPSGHLTGDGILKFPLNTSQISSWQPGYHYIYNVVINANDEMSPIQFGNPTVDTYVEVTTNYE